MMENPSLRWRLPLFAAGALLFAGGQMHPDGTMEQMLGDPIWIPGHLLVLAGYASLLAGLVLLRRAGEHPPLTRRWLRLAVLVTAGQTVEMVAHTVAVVDHGNLVAGHATPVLYTHYMLALVFYPLFAAGMIGLMVAGARERTLGSWWIAWIGAVGVAAQGVAVPLILATGNRGFSFLFAGILPLAVWMVLASLWPVRVPAASAASPSRPAPVPAAAGR